MYGLYGAIRQMWSPLEVMCRRSDVAPHRSLKLFLRESVVILFNFALESWTLEKGWTKVKIYFVINLDNVTNGTFQNIDDVISG